MGCSESKQEQGQDIAQEYAKKGLPAAETGTFDTEFEREAYQVVNLLRADPKSMIPQIKGVKNLPGYKGQPISAIVTKLQELSTLPTITLDRQCTQACSQNSDKKINGKEDSKDFEKGGNSEEYNKILGSSKGADTQEATYIGWQGTAQQMILFSIVDSYEPGKTHPILDPQLTKMGSSFKTHKTLKNVY